LVNNVNINVLKRRIATHLRATAVKINATYNQLL
jgi:hypothetical protein